MQINCKVFVRPLSSGLTSLIVNCAHMAREVLQTRPIELTTRAVSPNLNRGGVIFMSGGEATANVDIPLPRNIDRRQVPVNPTQIAPDSELVLRVISPTVSRSDVEAAWAVSRAKFVASQGGKVFVGLMKAFDDQIRESVNKGEMPPPELFGSPGSEDKAEQQRTIKSIKMQVACGTGRDPEQFTEEQLVEIASVLDANFRVATQGKALSSEEKARKKKVAMLLEESNIIEAESSWDSLIHFPGRGKDRGSADSGATPPGGPPSGGDGTGGSDGGGGDDGHKGRRKHKRRKGGGSDDEPPATGGGAEDESFRLYLTGLDREQLRRDPAEWTKSQFDIIYQYAEDGNEADSNLVQTMQQKASFAVNFLSDLHRLGKLKHLGPDDDVIQAKLKAFGREFSNRMFGMAFRSVIEGKNIDAAKQYSQMFQVSGLAGLMALDGGAVSAVYARMDESLEEARLRQDDFRIEEDKLVNQGARQLEGLTDAQRAQVRKILAQLLHLSNKGNSAEMKKIKDEFLGTGVGSDAMVALITLASSGKGEFAEDYRQASAGRVYRDADHPDEPINATEATTWVKERIFDALFSNQKQLADVRMDMGRFRVKSPTMSRLQPDLIKEQYEMAKYGGPFNEAYVKAVAAAEAARDADGMPLTAEAKKRAIERTVKIEITRAVKTAYDAWVISQRLGVIVSRGHVLHGTPILETDPIALFDPFNYEEFGLHRKQLGENAIQFLEAIQLKYADSIIEGNLKKFTGQKLERYKRQVAKMSMATKEGREARLAYGRMKFRDVAEVSDFWSSSWRDLNFVNGVRDRVAYHNSKIDEDNVARAARGEKLRSHIDPEDFGLFIKFPKSQDELASGLILGEYEKFPQWIRIAEIRPEEIIRIYRERAAGDEHLTKQLKRFFEKPIFDGLRVKVQGFDINGNPTTQDDFFRTYDKFKQLFGPLIQSLRQQGYHEKSGPRALRIGKDGFKTAAEQAQVVNYFKDDANRVAALGLDPAIATNAIILKRVEAMYAHFTETALDGVQLDPATGKRTSREFSVTDDLMNSVKLEDIYKRALVVDDTLIDLLEYPPPDSGLLPLSKKISPVKGGDGVVRAYNDLDAGIKGVAAISKFVRAEKFEEKSEGAFELGEACYNYSGQNLRAQAIRYTLGSTIGMSAEGFWWDALGFKKGPFRMKISLIEQIYGLSAKPMTVDDRIHAIDEIEHALIQSVDRNASEAEVRKQQAEAENLVKELRRAAYATGEDAVKRRGTTFMLYFLMACFAEGFQVLNKGSNMRVAA